MDKQKRQECLVFSRVVGWMTPIKNFNPGKLSEYKDRKAYENSIDITNNKA
jgi:anaerobic ribonucleoside-triphosphate reductase